MAQIPLDENPLFRQAVVALDAGDLAGLQQLIDAHPTLATEPLESLTGDYFHRPWLLWFVADNPIRNNTLPANIVAITDMLLKAVKRYAPDTAARQLDYALGLVVTGRTPRECGVQIAMMDVLIDAGAKPGGGLGALAHGNLAAAAHLIERGGTLTLPAAVGLNRMADIQRLLPTATEKEKFTALTMAAFYGNAGLVRYLLDNGVTPNGYPEKGSGFHEHATPLHQAVASGSQECITLLKAAGARTDAVDLIYNGTPQDWADYLQRQLK